VGQSLKAILQLIAIVAGTFALFAWFDSNHPDEIVWATRIGAPAIVIAISWLLIRNMRRKEILPDMLAKITPQYFEANGLSFAFVPAIADGICWMHVFFQNRYEKMCQARIVLTPPKTFFLGRSKTQGIDIQIDCEGAAFGVHRTPWPINQKLQGKTVKCEVGCTNRYPTGAGKLMRFREGLRCSPPSSGVARAAATAGFALVGVIRISRPSTVTLRMPAGVAVEIPAGIEDATEILWRPDLPTGGFPVVQMANKQ
jgi:hypothetical protein